MRIVNALKIRNQFGEVLQMLDEEDSPILIEKRKKVRAVLISYDDFLARFVDKLAEQERIRFVTRVHDHAAPSLFEADPLDTLRALRGYDT